MLDDFIEAIFVAVMWMVYLGVTIVAWLSFVSFVYFLSQTPYFFLIPGEFAGMVLFQVLSAMGFSKILDYLSPEEEDAE